MRINGTAVGLLRRALRLEDMLRAVQDQAIVSTRLAEERAEEIDNLAARLRKTDERRLELEERARESSERIAEIESDLAGARAAAGTLREQLMAKTREVLERDPGREPHPWMGRGWDGDRVAKIEAALQRAETEAQKARADAAIYANAIGRIEAALGLSGSRPPHEIVERVERLKGLVDKENERLAALYDMRWKDRERERDMRGLDGEGEG